jgi:hypothetical protein
MSGFGAPSALGGLVLHLLTFLKCPIPLHLNVRMVNEKILATIVGNDKPESLLLAEPLDSTGAQLNFLSSPCGPVLWNFPHYEVQGRFTEGNHTNPC